MTTIVDGKAIARTIGSALKKNVEALPRPLCLSIFIAGTDSASLAYVKKKMRLAEELGVTVYLHELVAGDGDQMLEKGILRDAKDPEVDGIIVQLPLPEGWNRDKLLNLIPLEKDVDVLTRASMASFREGKLPILPPIVGAIQAILETHGVAVADKDVLVIGRGRLVGQPVSLWLRHNDAHVTMIGDEVTDLGELAREADIIISGAGSPKLLTPDMVSGKTVVIDAGTSEDGGVLVGDVSPECREVVGLLSPVPGGVGPLTVVMLMKNLYLLGKARMN
jgi:methylenetetrahydrofolate dehydrogenase (NADP+)/methenyltetrahydrofolate cyclohydrolase